MSTHWRLYWNYVKEKEAWVQQLLKASAVGAPNRGSVFSFEEFKILVMTCYDPAKGVPFAVVTQKRFMGISLLLGALRTEQFTRFRKGGLEAIEWLRDNIDANHCQQKHTHTHGNRWWWWLSNTDGNELLCESQEPKRNEPGRDRRHILPDGGVFVRKTPPTHQNSW